MRTLGVKWSKPKTFDVRVNGVPLEFDADGKATTSIKDHGEYYVSWTAWGGPGKPYEFEFFMDGQSIKRSRPQAAIGYKQVAFGAFQV